MADDNWEKLASSFWQPLVDTRFSSSYPQLAAGSRVKALDTELGVLQTMMTRARKLRNRHTGGCSLPQEVLLTVFLFLRDNWPPTRSLDTEIEGLKFISGWMSITHVCSWWREVALGSPSLWAKQHHILGTPVLYIPTFISRAPNCPWDLRVDHQGIPGKDAQREEDEHHILSWFCRPICLRCEHLHLEGVSESLLRRIFDQAIPYLPDLKTLYLEPQSFVFAEIELPARLAGMHRVTDLGLHGFRLPWDSPIFSPSLVRLYLDVPGGHRGTSKPTFTQFKMLFARLHSLRTVTLSDFFPSDCSDETITMPSGLETFSFYTFYENKAALDLKILAQIRLPDTCTRVAGFNHELGALLPDANPNHLVNRCASTFMSFGASQACQELVYAESMIALLQTEHQMSIWPGGLEDIFHYSNSETPDIFLPGPYAYLSISEYDFTLSLGSLNLLKLRTMTFGLQACYAWDAEQWSRVASSAPRVRRVEISFSESIPLLQALTDVHNDVLVLFPSLRILVLHGPLEDIADEEYHLDVLTALTHLVHLRRSKGSPLDQVVVMQDTGIWGTWDALKDVVQIVLL